MVVEASLLPATQRGARLRSVKRRRDELALLLSVHVRLCQVRLRFECEASLLRVMSSQGNSAETGKETCFKASQEAERKKSSSE